MSEHERKQPRSKQHIRLEKPKPEALQDAVLDSERRRRGKLRRRWMTNTLAATFAVVAIAVTVFAVAMHSY